jgi:hypothetical protein
MPRLNRRVLVIVLTVLLDPTISPSAFAETARGKQFPSAQDSEINSSAGRPRKMLLNVIVDWLSHNFDLPADFRHPRFALLPHREVIRLRYGSHEMVGVGEVVAVYDDEQRTLYLSDDLWTDRSPVDSSVIVHEMVHHLQNLAELDYRCPQAREHLAYAAQEKWLAMFGGSLADDFGVDDLNLKLATTCY